MSMLNVCVNVECMCVRERETDEERISERDYRISFLRTSMCIGVSVCVCVRLGVCALCISVC